MTENPQTWYIVKRPTGNCEIVPSDQIEDDNPEIIEQWGPLASQEEAIARRVGLIRANKCQPQ
ncbi:transposase [aff. Roholtiella sp. LEGE 12411]|uniref:transposase n=1 Tax=aff. Roholtiella sp. LEGE 12411 TaxID=1828822 RepID=UPI00187E5DE5|nr:transposase [aff. Roholtiella sp. LEGE 12411]MBE9036512.1 transposase [aff. Roholtiella sp. LEGE 12411]